MKRQPDLEFRSQYWDDPHAKAAFQGFLRNVHRLDLARWDAAGYWDDELYTPFSLFDGDRVVSSVCLYTMEMVIDGQPRRVGQFSGVGTLPEYRRRGLNRLLTERALQWASPTHDGFFLFADEEALPFYRACGFRPVTESVAILELPGGGWEGPAGASPTSKSLAESPRQPRFRAEGSLRKLDIGCERDRARVYDRARRRSPVSEALGAVNAKLLMFHCLCTLSDCAYEIPDLDLVVFFRVDGERLLLFDLIGPCIPTFETLHSYLGQQPLREVWFHFLPDKLGVDVSRYEDTTENLAHVLPPFEPSSSRVLFPYTCHA